MKMSLEKLIIMPLLRSLGNSIKVYLGFKAFSRCREPHERVMDVWERLGNPRLILAPMVDASELAWRVLSRRHGADLCFTPMLHSSVFVRDVKYRTDALASCSEDHPRIVQFCGHDADVLVQAATLAQDYADVIDINLGCPQAIAKRGRYGAFLQDEWLLLTEIVSKLRKSLEIPVSCKIRVYPEISKTVEYALMLERAGANILTVHGRTREQKGRLTGLANWSQIKAVKAAVKVPVVANGNIQCIQDAERCFMETGCDGVMSAEGNLYNPFIFEGTYPPAWEPAAEYLDLVEKYPCPSSYIRGHLFKMLHHVLALPENSEIRAALAGRCEVSDFRKVVMAVRTKYLPYHNGEIQWIDGYRDDYNLELPPWLCKPYERPPVDDVDSCKEENEVKAKRPKNDRQPDLSKRQKKKLLKQSGNNTGVGRIVDICAFEDCYNPAGMKCDSRYCKVCCRRKCYDDDLDCIGHGILIKSRREKAQLFEKLRLEGKSADAVTI